jgi:nicotinamide phosphoribosyltransferase
LINKIFSERKDNNNYGEYKMRNNNLILRTDSYKMSHFPIFVDNMESSFYYITTRGGDYEEIVPFGLQYYIKEYLTTPISQTNIDEAEQVNKLHGVPFNKEGWQHILADHGGYLPLRIRSVPEGTPIPVKNVIATIETTCKKCAWVAGYMETLLLKIWYPTTVASRSRAIKKIIMTALNKSSDNPEAEIDFKLNAFGYRGNSSEESGAIGGAAELIAFKGSDTLAGILLARDYYGCPMAGFSIPATEHSVITSFGKENELEAYRKFLKVYAKPGALIACVSDSYDLWNCIEKFWRGALKEDIINSGATLVVRLDSGDALETVPRALKMLDEGFGHIINTKGYKVLNYVKILQGDGIDEHSLKDILDIILENGYSATNIAFGCGAGIIQKLDRDTCRFACKMSSATINGVEQNIFKDPATDHSKASLAGRLDLMQSREYNTYHTVVLKNGDYSSAWTAMQTVFENGKILVDDTLENIRARAAKGA